MASATAGQYKQCYVVWQGFQVKLCDLTRVNHLNNNATVISAIFIKRSLKSVKCECVMWSYIFVLLSCPVSAAWSLDVEVAVQGLLTPLIVCFVATCCFLKHNIKMLVYNILHLIHYCTLGAATTNIAVRLLRFNPLYPAFCYNIPTASSGKNHQSWIIP